MLEAQAVCDRRNLRAVLEAIKVMDRPVSREFIREIDALIKEIEA